MNINFARIAKIAWISSLLGFGILTIGGCGTLELGIEHPPITNEGVIKTIAAMETINANLAALIRVTESSSQGVLTQPPPSIESEQNTVTPTYTPTPTHTPTLTETPGPPQFSSLYFSTQPDGLPQRFFVQGIQRVYAIWDYQNMDIGVVFRRLWEKDGELWAERYTTWDMQKYGSRGTLKDIFIFDFDFGLQTGEYSLSLDINGVTQTFTDGDKTVDHLDFWVVPSEIAGPVTSPNRAYTIFIFGGGRLAVGDRDGNMRDLVVTTEISSVAWFPDSRHILYTDKDRTKQFELGSDIGISHQLWILDVVTGERSMIGTSEENFHHPVISPGGRYIAVLSGNTYQDGCQPSPLLYILEVDNQLQRTNIFKVTDFSGLPSSSAQGDLVIYPGYLSWTGSWENENTFSTYLIWACAADTATNDGSYLLRLDNLQAERYGNP